MPVVQEHHLLDLAERPTGKAYLGEIVRRLAYATVAKRRPGLHFLAGETNNYSGWDGWVEVPLDVGGVEVTHRSLWELSTDRNIEKKIRADYEAALQKVLPHSWRKREVIYVGATLRSLTSDAKKKIKRGLITDYGKPYWGIVILAADDFVEWIEKVHAVEDWMATEFKIGNNRFGRSLEHAWRAWSEQTSPHVSEQLVLVDRDLAPLRTALKFDPAKTVWIQCDSVEEAVAVVYCAIRTLPESDARLMMANCLVVTDDSAASQLVDQTVAPDGMPLAILVPPATTQSQRLVNAGYHVIHAFGRKEESATVLAFERASVQGFAKALTDSMNVQPTNAEAEARACGCSVAVWHIRNLYKRPLQPVLPPWVDASHVDLVVPAVFLSAWHDLSKPDADVIELLAGIRSAEFSGRLQKFSQGPTPLLEYIGPERFVVAPTAAFEFVARSITRSHIERLEKVCKGVFSRVSPEVAERWEGGDSEPRIRNRREELSESLLDGLAETLLRIAVLGAPLQASGALGSYGSAQGFVDNLVRNLPGLSNDPRILASLDQQLPYLIEGSPLSFFEALETLIQGRPSELARLFADEPGIFGRSFHTGLLWGLESLAWSPEYLPRVAEILAGLASLDPGGQLSNRPFNTLCDVFLAWHPGTMSSPEHRAEVLSDVLERNPQTGWRAIVELLPDKRRIATTNHRPVWRNLVHGDVRPTRAEVFRAYQLYIELALDSAGQNILRLGDLIDAYPRLSPLHQTALEQKLLAVPIDAASPDEIEVLWRRVHHVIARHRGFSDANWALSEEVLRRLENVAKRFIPEDPVTRNRWLFDEQFPETGHREADYDGRTRELEKRRTDALTDILEKSGWEGVHRLIKEVHYPSIVGHLIAEVVQDRMQILDAIDTWRAAGSKSEMLAIQAASSRRKVVDEAWTEALLWFANARSWPPEVLATALLDFPDEMSTYELIAKLPEAVREQYWRRRSGFIRIFDNDQLSFQTAVKAFVENGRAYDLIDQDWHRLNKLGYRPLLAVVDAFIKELSTSTKPIEGGALDHDVQHIFDWLRKQPEAEASEIARREYALLPLLASYGDSSASLSLHELMRTDPTFYVDVVSDLYRGDSDEKLPEGEALEQARRRAEAAFELLNSWRSPPGVQGGRLDESELNSWVDAARSALKERDRADIGDQQIGKILYHLPADEEGRWPSVPLCKLLQRLHSIQIERGMEVENFNSRGTTTRAMYEGGAQERLLETEWQKRAASLESKWSRARALCARIAAQWRGHADLEDLSAKSDKVRRSR